MSATLQKADDSPIDKNLIREMRHRQFQEDVLIVDHKIRLSQMSKATLRNQKKGSRYDPESDDYSCYSSHNEITTAPMLPSRVLTKVSDDMGDVVETPKEEKECLCYDPHRGGETPRS